MFFSTTPTDDKRSSSTFANTNTPPSENPTTEEPSHFGSCPIVNERIRNLVRFPHCRCRHQHDANSRRAAYVKRERDDAALSLARSLYRLGITLYIITSLTFLLARYRAITSGSVMEEAVVRVEFETR